MIRPSWISTSPEIDPKNMEAYISRGKAYYLKGIRQGAGDIKKAQDLGYKIPIEFLDELRKAPEKKK